MLEAWSWVDSVCWNAMFPEQEKPGYRQSVSINTAGKSLDSRSVLDSQQDRYIASHESRILLNFINFESPTLIPGEMACIIRKD